MTATAKVVADCYVDSVRLLEATRAMREAPGVDWAWALMATPANLEVLFEEGVTEGLDGAAANDLVLAVKGADENLPAALLRAWAVLFEETGSGGHRRPVCRTHAPLDLDDALVSAPEANVAIVSVPGPYAALEAHKALTRGLDVLLFSDNVDLADEIDLKRRARSLGRLVMGPGAGTAVLAGVGLGFSNRVAPGPVGVVAAAGTGAQEVMTLLDRWGSRGVPCHRGGRPGPLGRGLRRHGRGGHRGARPPRRDRVDAPGVQAARGRGRRAPAGRFPQQAAGGRIDRVGPAGGRRCPASRCAARSRRVPRPLWARSVRRNPTQLARSTLTSPWSPLPSARPAGAWSGCSAGALWPTRPW